MCLEFKLCVKLRFTFVIIVVSLELCHFVSLRVRLEVVITTVGCVLKEVLFAL